jgi:hypothetical protein
MVDGRECDDARSVSGGLGGRYAFDEQRLLAEYLRKVDDSGCGCESDPLDAIRRNAGLPIDAEVEHPEAIVISQGISEPRF